MSKIKSKIKNQRSKTRNFKPEIDEMVMEKIRSGEVQMRPKIYFIAGFFMVLIGFIGLTFFSIFLISLITFSLKSHGPMGTIRFQQILFSFPWWALILVFIGLTTGIILLKKYDFSYKKNFLFIILVFISAVLLTGILVDILGFDNLWIKKGPMRRFYQQYERNDKKESNKVIKKNRHGRNF